MSWNGSVRAAVVSDAYSIALIHVDSWKTTYAGLLPDAYLSSLNVESRERFWTEALTTPTVRSLTFLVCDSKQNVLGFVSGGEERTRELGYDGELYAIYLPLEQQRQGLGTRLVRRLVTELIALGFRSMLVWVLDENPSRKFYEVLGGKRIKEQTIERGGEAFVETAYGWDDLHRLERYLSGEHGS